MAGRSFDTEALIDNIQRRCSVPQSQLTYTAEDFTLIADDVLHDEVVPLLMSTREEYFVDFVDTEMPSDKTIAFPTDTVASKVRSVCYRQALSPLNLINIPRLSLDTVAGVGFCGVNTLAGFYIQGSDLVFYPPDSIPVNTNIRIYYYKRVLALAAPLTYGQVTTIDSDTLTLTLDSVPTTWASDTVINSVNSGMPFETTNEGMIIQSVSSPDIVVDTVDGVAVGDYVSLQGFSAVPQIPQEAHAYLAQLTAGMCLQGLGDREGEAAVMKKAEVLKTNLLVMLSSRVDGSAKKIVNQNRFQYGNTYSRSGR